MSEEANNHPTGTTESSQTEATGEAKPNEPNGPMPSLSAVIDVDENLRLVGTAHISRASADLVRSEIESWSPQIVAVELCKSRLASLRDPERFDNETLGSVIKSGRAPLLLIQSLLAMEQRRLGLDAGEKPGVDLLSAIDAGEEIGARVELVDRDIQVTLRRAWTKMRLREKSRMLMALLGPEEDEDIDIEEMVQDSDLLSQLLDEMRELAPGAGEVLIDERDEYIAAKIQSLRGHEKVLAVLGAGHLEGVASRLNADAVTDSSRFEELNTLPEKKGFKKAAPWLIPAMMMGIVVFLLSRGDYTSLKETAYDWLLLNAVLAALAVLLVRGHPVAILTAGIASPITSLNPTFAVGWFAGAAQMRYAAPTGRDLSDFLMLDRFSLFWSNRVGRVLLVTVAGNIGSSVGAILAGSWIISSLFS